MNRFNDQTLGITQRGNPWTDNVAKAQSETQGKKLTEKQQQVMTAAREKTLSVQIPHQWENSGRSCFYNWVVGVNDKTTISKSQGTLFSNQKHLNLGLGKKMSPAPHTHNHACHIFTSF